MTTVCYMNGSNEVGAAGIPAEPSRGAGAQPGRHYEPPAVTYLGTLHEFTLGDTTVPTTVSKAPEPSGPSKREVPEWLLPDRSRRPAGLRRRRGF